MWRQDYSKPGRKQVPDSNELNTYSRVAYDWELLEFLPAWDLWENIKKASLPANKAAESGTVKKKKLNNIWEKSQHHWSKNLN